MSISLLVASSSHHERTRPLNPDVVAEPTNLTIVTWSHSLQYGSAALACTRQHVGSRHRRSSASTSKAAVTRSKRRCATRHRKHLRVHFGHESRMDPDMSTSEPLDERLAEEEPEP